MRTTSSNIRGMKKGFTMIELIFVIVILGILASVAIPKMAASRDDAKIVKTLSEITAFKKELTTYYAAQGTFAGNLGDITNLASTSSTTNGGLFTNSNCSTPITATTSIPATGIKTLYYCVPNSKTNSLERLFTVATDDADGFINFTDDTSQSGNIGKGVRLSSSYQPLITDVKIGGKKVSF